MEYGEGYVLSKDSGFSSKESDSKSFRRAAWSFSPIDKPLTLPLRTRTLSRKSLYSPEVYYVSPRKNVDILKISRQSSQLSPSPLESRQSFNSLDGLRMSLWKQINNRKENPNYASRFKTLTDSSGRKSGLSRSSYKYQRKPSSSLSLTESSYLDFDVSRSQRTSTVSVLSGSRTPTSSFTCGIVLVLCSFYLF